MVASLQALTITHTVSFMVDLSLQPDMSEILEMFRLMMMETLRYLFRILKFPSTDHTPWLDELACSTRTKMT